MPGGGLLRCAVIGGQDAEVLRRLGHKPVELAFIVEPRNDAVLQILIRAGLQLPAEGEERRRRAAVQPARYIILPAVVGDRGTAFAAAVVGVEHRSPAVVGQVADCREGLPGGRVGQQLGGGDDAGAVQVGVGKKQIVEFCERSLLPEEGIEPLHRAVGPRQRLLRNAAHIGRVLIRDVVGIGKDEEGAVAVRQEVCLEVGVKIAPERNISAGADIKNSEGFHTITCLQDSYFFSSFLATLPPYWRR